jgi:hypothetical protein
VNALQHNAQARRLFVVISMVIALVAVNAAIGLPNANATFKVYSASVTPSTVAAGAPVTLTFTVKNSSISFYPLGSVQVAVPAGYTNVTLGSATTSTGKTWAMRFGTCQTYSPSPCPAAGTMLVETDAVATDGSDLLTAGKSVTFTVSATAPLTGGATTWKTAAKTSRDFSGTSCFLLSGSQPTVTVLAPVATQLVASAAPTSDAGSSLGVNVSARTSTGDVVPTFAQAATITSSDPSAVLPNGVTFANGLASFTVELRTSGPQTVTIVAGGLTTSINVNVAPAAAVALSLTGLPTADVSAGTAFDVTVEARDPYNNLATGYQGPVSFTSSQPTDLPLPSAGAVSNGRQTFSIKLTTAAAQTLTVTDDGHPTLTASGAVTVTAGQASRFVLSGPTGSGAGDSASFSLATKDAFGNAVTSFAGAVTVTAPGDPQAQLITGGGPVPLPTVVNVSGGSANFVVSLRTSGHQAVVVNGGGDLTGQASVDVAAGAPSLLTLISGPVGSVPAGPLPNVVVGIFDGYGNQTTDTGTSVSVGVAPTGSGVTGTLTVASVNGAATFGNLAVAKAGNYTLSASAGALTPTDTPLVVLPASADRLLIDSVTDTLGGGQPVQGRSITVQLHSEDGFGNLAPVTSDTLVTLTTNKQALGGTTSGTILAGHSGLTIIGATYPAFENQVTFIALASQFVSGSRLVDVQSSGVFQAVTPGVAATLQLPDCIDATPAVPTCSTFLLPKGASGTAYLTQGECNPYQPCRVSSTTGVSALLVSAKANFKNALGQPLYSRTQPATVIIRCDKTLCGGSGIKSFPLYVDITDSGPFVSAPPCQCKGQIPTTGPAFCIDNVQSKRDQAGDLVQYLLVAADPRIAPR